MGRGERQLRRDAKLLAKERKRVCAWVADCFDAVPAGGATLSSAPVLVHRGGHGGHLWVFDHEGALLGVSRDGLSGRPSWRLCDTGGRLSSDDGRPLEGRPVVELRRIKGWGVPRANATFVVRRSHEADEITVPCGEEPAERPSLAADDQLQRCPIMIAGATLGFLAMPPWAMGPWQVEDRSGRVVADMWHVDYRKRAVGTITVLEDDIVDPLRAVALVTPFIADNRHIVIGN